MKYRLIILLFITGTVSAQIIPVGLDDIDTVTEMIIAISIGFAVLMIGFHVFKLMASETAEDRKEAKDGIIHVIVGLVMVIIAVVLVNFIYTAPSY